MTDSESASQWQRSFLGVVALVLWSTTVASARVLSEQVGTFTAGSYSYIIGGVLGLAYLGANRDRIRNLSALPRGYMAVCGGLFVLYNILLYLAIGLATTRMQVLGVTLINYLWPSLMLIFAVLVLKRKANVLSLGLGLVISFIGAYFAANQHSDVSWSTLLAATGAGPAPYLLALGAAIAWGLYSVLNKLWMEKSNISEGHLLVPPVFLLSGVLMLAAKPFFQETSVWTPYSLAALIYLSLFPWLIAYLLWAMATQKGKIVFLGIVSMFLPLSSTLVNCLYLKVAPGPAIWISCVLIMAGAAVCMKSVRD